MKIKSLKKVEIEAGRVIVAIFFLITQVVSFAPVSFGDKAVIDPVSGIPVPTQSATASNQTSSSTPQNTSINSTNTESLAPSALSQATTSEEPPSVPEGWNQTSDPNYAYRVMPRPLESETSRYKDLVLLDLRTNVSTVITTIDTSVHDVADFDVSADGKIATFKLKDAQGNTVDSYHYDITDQTLWAKAKSSEQFGFRTEVVNGHGLRLHLRDLQTGTSQLLAFASIESYGDRIFDVRDVSPDGQYVAFRTVPSNARVQRIDDPAKGITIPMFLTRISWLQDSSTVILKSFSGRTVVIDLQTMTTWVPAASNSDSDFAFRIDSKTIRVERCYYFPHYYCLGRTVTKQTLKLLNLKTNQIQDVDTADYASFTFSSVYNVSPDGKYVAFARETSLVTSARVQKIDDPKTGVDILIGDRGILTRLASLSWSKDVPTSKAILKNQEGTKTYIVNLQTMTYETSTTQIVQAPSNANFAFHIISSSIEKEIYVVNKQTGEKTLITTAKPDQVVTALDVDPTGKFAFVNVWRRDILDPSVGSYVDTGDIHVFDIASKTIKATIPERVESTLGKNYVFVDGLVVFNRYNVRFTGTTSFTTRIGIVFNLNTLKGAGVSGYIALNGSILFTPQKDKLLVITGPNPYAGNTSGFTSIAIFDVAQGLVTQKFLGASNAIEIKAISPDGNYTVVKLSDLGVIAIVTVRNPNKAPQYVSFPAPDNSSPGLLASANFLDNTLADLTVVSGRRYVLDMATLAIAPRYAFNVIPGFYGGALPPGARLIYSQPSRNAAGTITAWTIQILLNQNGIPGTTQSQVFVIRPIANIWRVVEVHDRDYQNQNLSRSVFNYSTSLGGGPASPPAQLVSITRYNRNGVLISMIYNRGTYWEIRTTITQRRKILGSLTPLARLLIEARILGG